MTVEINGDHHQEDPTDLSNKAGPQTSEVSSPIKASSGFMISDLLSRAAPEADPRHFYVAAAAAAMAQQQAAVAAAVAASANSSSSSSHPGLSSDEGSEDGGKTFAVI